jgi:hypothetical protein
MMAQTDFSLASYGALLDELASRSYKVVGFEEADPAERHLVLRHDLDLSVEAALPMAEIEADRNLSASYFVLLRSTLYNPFTASALAALKRLGALGHDIGLHLDASLYGDEPNVLDRAAERECTALEALLGLRVGMISFHRPAPALQGREGTVGGRRHAYEPRFFRDMGYCSDSRGAWHHGHPLDHPAVSAGRALQLLTHPIWWVSEETAPEACLDRWLEARADILDEALAENIALHRARRCRLTWNRS